MTTRRLFTTETEKRAWMALLVLAALLRLVALDARPFHHDESIHAWASNRLAFEGVYVYDPVYHGPVQYYLVAAALRIEGLFASPKAMVAGEGDLAARLPAALGGVALVALALLLRPRFGAAVAFVSGAILALSPDFLYFTRFCREDVWSLLGTAGGFLFLDSWVRESRLGDLVLSSLLFSIAFASKENFYVLCALMVPSILAAWAEPGRGFDVWNRLRRLIDFLEKNAVAIAGAILLFFNVSLLLYTVFLVHPESGNPALTAISYWWGQHKVERVGGPKTYYLPRLLQYEFAILLPALALIFFRWRKLTAVERFLAGWGISSLLMYAYLGEKTPWLLLHQILPFVLLAARAWVSVWESGTRGRVLGALAATVTTWFSLGLSFSHPALSPVVPKAESVVYVQTAPEVLDLRDRILAYGRVGEVPAAIIAGEAGWPMSWYVRRAPVNWEVPRGDLRPPIVVCDQGQAPKAAAALGPGYIREADVPLRAWWIPETSLSPLVPSPGDLLKYLVTREVWRGKLPPSVNPIGALYVAVFRRVGPAAEPLPAPPAGTP
ncbi:MAG: flippase activity-associated protein Agl23 [Thermoanaerobaculia bacterium]